MAQTWRNLLFAHWPVSPALLRPWLPSGLALDTFSGDAWLGVVPFLMTGIRFRGTPPVPYFSRTLELNLRTYVQTGDKPGVFFFSLDAASPLAVRIARRFFHLPYFDARMSCTENAGVFEYRSTRKHRHAAHADFHSRYRPIAPVALSTPGTLEHFLTARYCFYTADGAGQLLRGDIAHPPWPLQPAEAEFPVNCLTLPWNIELPDTSPVLHFSRRLDVHALGLPRLNAHRRL